MNEAVTITAPRTAPLRVNPQSLLLYGGYKVGKTASAATLPDTLLLELQPGGADYAPNAWVQEIEDRKHFASVLQYLREKRIAKTPIARRIIVDHLGILDEWIFEWALEEFFSTPKGRFYKAGDNAIKEITDLPGQKGSPGWAWVREQLSIWHHNLLMAADEIVYIGHTREARADKEQGEVSYQDVDITGGKGRRLFCGQSSAIGFMFRRRVILDGQEEDQLVVTFKTSESVVCGCSCPHLSGKEFVIGRSTGGKPPVFNWQEIYPA